MAKKQKQKQKQDKSVSFKVRNLPKQSEVDFSLGARAHDKYGNLVWAK